MLTDINNRGESTVSVDEWVVVVPLTGISPSSAYLEPVLYQEITLITEEDFGNNIGEIILLQDCMYLFEYFKGVDTTKIPVEADTLSIIMQSNEHATPLKIIKVDPGMTLGKE